MWTTMQLQEDRGATHTMQQGNKASAYVRWSTMCSHDCPHIACITCMLRWEVGGAKVMQLLLERCHMHVVLTTAVWEAGAHAAAKQVRLCMQ